MNEMKLKTLKLFYWHLLFYFLFYELRSSLETQSLEELAAWLSFKDGLLNLSSLLIFFAYSLGSYLILFYNYPKNILKVIIGLIAIFFISTTSRYLIEEIVFLRLFGFDNYYDKMSTLIYVLRNLFYGLLHIGFGGIFFFIQYSAFKEKQAQELLIENKKTELAYLRSQMNPHFLFNTLNNIYSLVYQKSEKSLPALEKLTAMLRYGLYEGEDKVALEKEINNIQNFINLEEMRYAFPLNIHFKIDGNIETIKLPPFLLLPIIENAFKHGDMKKVLDIDLKVLDKQLRFEVKNQIKIKQKDRLGGIGLENIKKRLKLIYNQDYQFLINKNETNFGILLVINT